MRQVASTHLPSAETSMPVMGSPRAGMAVLARTPTRSKRRMSPFSEATAMYPFSVVVAAEKAFLEEVAYC